MNKLEALKSLIAQGEGLTIEFKESRTQLNKDVYETVCAFANRAGGHLFLGVKDNGEVVGVEVDAAESIRKNFVTTINNAQKFSPPLYLVVDEITIDEKLVLYIEVPASHDVHSLNNKIFDKNNESDINITGQNANIARLYLNKQNIYTEDRVYPYATLEDFDLELIKKVRIMAANRRMDEHPWQSMSDIELIKSSGLYRVDKVNNQAGFTLAAILLFGKPETILNVLPHHKTDLILRKVNLDRYDDREIIETNLIESYHRMAEFVRKHLNDPFYLEGDVRISLRDKIFREAIANSLIHREYSSVFVAKMLIEKNQVLFENATIPHFYGLLTPENFTPYPKNPTIAKIFREIGFADELGSGVKNIYKYAKAYGGSDPVIEEGEVFRIKIQISQETTQKNVGVNVGVNELYDFISQNPPMRANVMAQHFPQITQRTIERWLKELKEAGKIEYIGSPKTGGYRCIND